VRSIPSSGQVEAAKDARQDSNDVFVKKIADVLLLLDVKYDYV
jgi:hypothetical protein